MLHLGFSDGLRLGFVFTVLGLEPGAMSVTTSTAVMDVCGWMWIIGSPNSLVEAIYVRGTGVKRYRYTPQAWMQYQLLLSPNRAVPEP